jgi:hypothetical protein
VWIHSTYVSSTNTVIPKKLNVRAGPGENYSVVGKDRWRRARERDFPLKVIGSKSKRRPESYCIRGGEKYIKQEGKVHDVPNCGHDC